jgi:hypothetical protein
MRKVKIRKVWIPTPYSECVIYDKGDAVIMSNLRYGVSLCQMEENRTNLCKSRNVADVIQRVGDGFNKDGLRLFVNGSYKIFSFSSGDELDTNPIDFECYCRMLTSLDLSVSR